MQIYVRVNNKTIILDVEPSDSVDKVKAKILEKEQIPADLYYLTYGGRWVRNEHTLS